MKSFIVLLVILAAIIWSVYFFTHMGTLCQLWWFASEDLCIRYNTTH